MHFKGVLCTKYIYSRCDQLLPFLYFRKGSDNMKFICYSVFGWGMPILMAILTFLFDIFPNWGNVRPQMGQSACFLSMRGARFFFYMPIMILLCFNTLMYLMTVYSLWKSKQFSKKAGLNRVVKVDGKKNTAVTITKTVVSSFSLFSKSICIASFWM